ncbi:hypothetical protein M8J77_001413 [Diaphorina citri]|nr:hypothetical protein M8J77_001413 [Diaphorina citri]
MKSVVPVLTVLYSSVHRFFARFTVEKAPKTTPTSQTAGNTSTSQSVQGTNPDAKSSKEETSPKVPAINAFAKMMERQVVCS